MPKLLLHSCCAPCSTSVIERLKEESYEITCYYYNPNIHPLEEYQKRWQEMKNWCQKVGIFLIEANYEKDKWFDLTKGLEKEPERGKRCTVCYEMRMEHAANYAQKNGFDIFTTVLSVSPHKDAWQINQIGKQLEQKYKIPYLTADFKKQNGFLRSLELSKKYKLFRQTYCGCEYSKGTN
jgi:epoxyqueuosine reductase